MTVHRVTPASELLCGGAKAAILKALLETPAASPAHLYARTGFSKTATRYALARLEAAGVVAFVRDAGTVTVAVAPGRESLVREVAALDEMSPTQEDDIQSEDLAALALRLATPTGVVAHVGKLGPSERALPVTGAVWRGAATPE